jgi:hypothetical protein
MAGGTHVINGFFEGADKIQLVGYNLNQVFNQDLKVQGGNTIISLDHGRTTITLVGFTNLHKSDLTSYTDFR